MAIYRVIYKTGGSIDIEATYVEAIDGYIWMWEKLRNSPNAILPDTNVWAVALKDSIKDRNFIPDGTGNMIEVSKMDAGEMKAFTEELLSGAAKAIERGISP